MGCGRVGIAAAVALSQEGYELRILDTDVSAFDLLPKDCWKRGT